jgi:acyl-coenzyme A thioesterase PaaI-like protein
MKTLRPPTAGQLAALRRAAHPDCVMCSQANPDGFRLVSTVMPDGSVEGEFVGRETLQGYSGWLHGGLIATLLDSAMTQCLFAHGCRAFTAELTVRYRHPVAAKERLTVRAWLADARAALHFVRAELQQAGQVKAAARGKFMEIHE